MEFKVLYSKLVRKYLQEYESLRIKFNASGNITEVEVLNKGTWSQTSAIFKEFTRLSIKPLNINKSMILTLK